MLGTMAGCPIHVDRIPNPDNQPRFAEESRFFAVAPQVREWALTGDRLPAAPSVPDRRSSRDGNPPGFRLEFSGFQAAGVENSRGVSVMKRSKTPAVDPVEVRGETGTAERFQRGLRRALGTPPQHRTPPALKAKERPASKGRVHKGKTRS